MSWLNRTSLKLVRASPAKMALRYPGDVPFVDGAGNAQSNATWLWSPDLTPVAGVPQRYWLLTGDTLSEMDQAAKDAADAAIAAALVSANRTQAAAAVDTTAEPVGWETRSLIELLNKRDNYLTNRIAELQGAFNAAKASTGAAQNIRDAIPSSWLATNTRPRPDAVSEYRDEITSGGVDS